jgi:hypothetical protein
MQVDKPNLNRGVSAGIKQPSFGNFRGADFSFPTNLSRSQPPPTLQTQGRFTYDIPILPVDGSWDNRWNTGTFYMVKKDNNQLKQLFCLPFARTLMAQNGLAMHVSRRKALFSTGDEADDDYYDEDSPTGGNGLQGSGTLKQFVKSRARDYSFMGDMDMIAKELDFSGIGIGPVDPSLQVGTADMGNTAKYTGHAKHVPAVHHGHCVMPNLWNTALRAGQDLFVIVKPRLVKNNYYNPSGEVMALPSTYKDYDTIPDFMFYTNVDNKPPVRCSDNTAELEGKGGQPPLYDRSYIDWDCDKSGNPVRGTLKDALVWKIGAVYSMQTSRAANVSRLNVKPAEPLAFERDYNTFPMMEVFLNPSRVY